MVGFITGVYVADFFKWQCILGMAMFLYASWQQYNIHVMFARLRQNKAGKSLSTFRCLPLPILPLFPSFPQSFV